METQNLPKTRAEAQAQQSKYYFTGIPCKHGHIAPRKTKGACTECVKIEAKNGLEKRAEYFTLYNKSDRGKEVKEKYYEKNKELVKARAMARPDEEKKQYRKNWRENNPDKIRADNKNRRRKHRQASPPWLTYMQKKEMRSIYQSAIVMSRLLGERYVVDHIVPLRSPLVCGLHVPWNLRVMTQTENLRKSNKFSNED